MEEPRVTDYRVPLEGDEDFLRVHLVILEGRVIGLVIQYEAIIDDELVEIVRYDTSHGFLHRHRFWLQSKNQTDNLEDPSRPARDYTQQVNLARDDLVANWLSYRERMERALRKGNKDNQWR